ncbi:hypothetical protein CD798_08420 [Bacillaceae bacterium SAOS 7]|nr:hypothetical protein CD798_08420 [Bacillaceae bacterium SAOS 7]
MDMLLNWYANIAVYWPVLITLFYMIGKYVGFNEGVKCSVSTIWSLLNEDDKKSIKQMKIHNKNIPFK